MRISLLPMVVVAVMLLGGCGGGMNSSNADAPKADEAHETTWVTYHRNALIDTSKPFDQYSTGRALINSHIVNECDVCHAVGVRDLHNAPECLNCHILDPVTYPFQCYSCHGGSPVVTFDKWFARFSSARRGTPISQEFRDNVSSGKYHNRDVSPATNHDVLHLQSVDQQVCRRCHDDPTGQDRSLADRHHALMNSNEPWVTTDGCFYCHSFSFSIGPDGIPVFDFTPDRNCASCHN